MIASYPQLLISENKYNAAIWLRLSSWDFHRIFKYLEVGGSGDLVDTIFIWTRLQTL
jgi:hypothetical protein